MSMDETKINQLVQEIEENKQKLHELVSKLESISDNVDAIIPKKIDYKTVYIAAERVKIVSSLFETILRYRSEITSQIKEQFNILKSFEVSDDLDKFKDIVTSMEPRQILDILKETEEPNTQEITN